MVVENIVLPTSGALFTGSKTFGQFLLYGISGGVAIPVAVNGSGQILTV